MSTLVQIHDISTSSLDGLGISLNIFFQGCNKRCVGCQNPELQDFSGGKSYNIDDILYFIHENHDFYQSIVMTGGDPLCQPKALYIMASNIILPTILYTGEYFDRIPCSIKSAVAIIEDGPFIQSLETYGKFPASSNQKIWFNTKKLLSCDINSFIDKHSIEEDYIKYY